jgi:uncharacterized protein YndB with AHSA1/START domain
METTPTDPSSTDTAIADSPLTDAAPSVRRETVLPSAPDRVMEALLDPELVATWLGACSDDGTRIRTDDDVVRRITQRRCDGERTLSWTWAPESRPDDASDVVFTLTPEGGGTRLVVRETRAPGTSTPVASSAATNARTNALALAADRWTGCLLALGAVLQAHAAHPAMR